MAARYPLRLLLLASFIVLQAQAEEYSAQPILGITTDIEDNRRLILNDNLVETTLGLRTEAQLQLIMLSEDTSVYITPKIRLNRYSEDVGLDTEDAIIDLDLTHLLSERHQFGVSAGYSLEAVSTTSTVIDPVSLTAASLNFNEIDQERLRFAPNYTYLFNERTRLQFGYSYTDVAYDDNSGRFIDYNYNVYSLTGGYALTETDNLSIVLYRTEYEPEAPTETVNNAFQITYAKDFSETLRASVGGGLTFGESETTFQTLAGPVTVDSSQTGELIALSLEKDFEYTSLRASFDRQVSPSSQGNERVSDNLAFSLSRRFSERLIGRLGVTFLESDDGFTRQGGASGSQYFNISSGLTYRLTPHWNVSGGYRYRQVENLNGANERDSNNAYVTFTYRPNKYLFHDWF